MAQILHTPLTAGLNYHRCQAPPPVETPPSRIYMQADFSCSYFFLHLQLFFWTICSYFFLHLQLFFLTLCSYFLHMLFFLQHLQFFFLQLHLFFWNHLQLFLFAFAVPFLHLHFCLRFSLAFETCLRATAIFFAFAVSFLHLHFCVFVFSFCI